MQFKICEFLPSERIVWRKARYSGRPTGMPIPRLHAVLWSVFGSFLLKVTSLLIFSLQLHIIPRLEKLQCPEYLNEFFSIKYLILLGFCKLGIVIYNLQNFVTFVCLSSLSSLWQPGCHVRMLNKHLQ